VSDPLSQRLALEALGPDAVDRLRAGARKASPEPRTVTAFVPFLPSHWLSPNRGERREGRVPAEITQAKRQLRADTAIWLSSLPQVQAVTEPFQRARLSCVYRWHKRRSDGL
jgi:hypothetical protein